MSEAIKNLNVSKIFMVPTLKIDEKHIKTHNFINSYSKDPNKEEYDIANHVFLLFKPKNMDNFQWFVDEEYDRTDAILEDYNVSSDHIVLVYRLNEEFKDDFSLIREGKYSKTSLKFQNLFKKVKTVFEEGENKDKMSLQWQIFTKEEDLRKFWEGDDVIGSKLPKESEVWSIFDENKETLTSEKIKELV